MAAGARTAPYRRSAIAAVAASLTALAASLAGCSSSGPRLHVSAPTSVSFVDTHGVRVSGARPGRPVVLQAVVTDAHHRDWTAQATFTADARGDVDTASQAPTRGSYTGVHATGLTASAARAGDDGFVLADGRARVAYRATQGGRSAGSSAQVRDLRSGITRTETTLSEDGVEGLLATPDRAPADSTSVVVLGGSEGGEPQAQAEALAQAGHPALAVAYFKAPGLPTTLQDVAVETVGRALDYLARQPGVDAHRIVVMGASRGSELALLAALHYPTQVAGVAVLSPTSQVNGGLPDGDAWTWRGRPVAQRAIPVRRVETPMLLVCGTDDRLWRSCPSTQTIVAESPGLPRTAVVEQDAGHLVDGLIPDLPEPSGTAGLEVVGGTVEADALGRLDAWPRALTWLDQVPALS